MRDAAHFRAQAKRCRALLREARRADLRDALASLAREFEAEAEAIEGADGSTEGTGGRGEDRPSEIAAEG
jgi:hypothetical protein